MLTRARISINAVSSLRARLELLKLQRRNFLGFKKKNSGILSDLRVGVFAI